MDFQPQAATEPRFAFGKNWQKFLKKIDERRICEAISSLSSMLKLTDLNSKNFLDIGCGSGLFSLAAIRLGAKVHSFDYDRDSIACANEMKSRYAPGSAWQIEQGSVLDSNYLMSLGTFDIVYSWGVLHHTGSMYEAFNNVVPLVKPEGTLFIAIYNDQGFLSKLWLRIKQLYNILPAPFRFILLISIAVLTEGAAATIRLLSFKNPLPFTTWKVKNSLRGMSYWTDLVDWVRGLPFEVAKPEEVFDFFYSRGFTLTKLVTKRAGQGCCEFVFRKTA